MATAARIASEEATLTGMFCRAYAEYSQRAKSLIPLFGDGPVTLRTALFCRWSGVVSACSPVGADCWQAWGVLIEHRGSIPQVHPSAYVAPTAVICGAVRIGPDARVLFGAVLTAEDGRISVGARSIVMENAVIRGRARHPAVIGDDVLVGPHAHVNGARVGDGCFLATGAALFPGSVVEEGSEVRIHGVVHVNTVLPPGATVPIGWVAVGDPAQIYPPAQHQHIWEIQESLDFPGTVYGVTPDTPAAERMSRQSAWFAAHRHDRILDESLRQQNDLPAAASEQVMPI